MIPIILILSLSVASLVESQSINEIGNLTFPNDKTTWQKYYIITSIITNIVTVILTL